MAVQDEVLRAAWEIARHRQDWSFGIAEIVAALPHLNERTVRTHVGSRCCVNAPPNHPHRWRYFRRLDRARYQVEPAYRKKPENRRDLKALARGGNPEQLLQSRSLGSGAAPPTQRDTIHAVVRRDGRTYVGECLEVAVVTQGLTLDELVQNLRQAIALHLEGEDMAALGLVEHPRVQLIYDMAAAS